MERSQQWHEIVESIVKFTLSFLPYKLFHPSYSVFSLELLNCKRFPSPTDNYKRHSGWKAQMVSFSIFLTCVANFSSRRCIYRCSKLWKRPKIWTNLHFPTIRNRNWIFHSVAKSPKCLILIFMPKMMIIFGVKVKCKKCSLRSQWGKVRLFEWFWHTVTTLCYHGQARTFWGQHSDFFCPRCASATQISASKVQILTGMKNKEERAE